MRAPIGPIRESEGGRDFIQNLFEECMQIMRCIELQLKIILSKNI
ncbi:hypothetical protein AAHB54_21825 [Bacillus cereus]